MASWLLSIPPELVSSLCCKAGWSGAGTRTEELSVSVRVASFVWNAASPAERQVAVKVFFAGKQLGPSGPVRRLRRCPPGRSGVVSRNAAREASALRIALDGTRCDFRVSDWRGGSWDNPVPVSPSRFVITRWRRATSVERERRQIRRIEIILARNSDQGEQRIAPCIGQRRSHAMRRIGFADGAHRPNPMTSIPLRNGQGPWSDE